MEVRLENLLQEINIRSVQSDQYPVLTSSKAGLFLQSDYFNKKIASKDNTGYKIIRRGQFTYRAMSDTGEFFPNMLECADIGIVSPAYPVFEITKPDVIAPEFLKYYFKSGKFQRSIASFAQGSTRTSVKYEKLKTVSIKLPSIEEQNRIVVVLNKVRSIIETRKKEIHCIDEIIRGRFVEMFGDLEINPKGWDKEPLKAHADVITGYPFPSEGYSSNGIAIVGGYNLMQGFVKWEESKHWPNEKGYEDYLLRENDIVMAMDRPWVNGGFKIARIDSAHLPALLIQRTACIRGRDVEQVFLHTMLDTKRFANHCSVTGSLVPHISNKDINSFEIVLPPIDKQKQFAGFVAQVDKSKLAIQKSLEETQLLFDSLMQKYFG